MAKNATVQGERKGTYDALAAASDSGVLHNPGNPQNTPSIRHYLRDGLPKKLQPHREMLERAVAETLPVRKQKWQSTRETVWDKETKQRVPLTGEHLQDPNALIVLAANAYLFHLEAYEGGSTRDYHITEGKRYLTIIESWAAELAPVFEAERVIAAFQKNAPVRMVH